MPRVTKEPDPFYSVGVRLPREIVERLDKITPAGTTRSGFLRDMLVDAIKQRERRLKAGLSVEEAENTEESVVVLKAQVALLRDMLEKKPSL